MFKMIDISRRKQLWAKDIGINKVFIINKIIREMSWYVIDCAAASRIISMLLSITTSIHVDLSYLNNFNCKLKEHELQQYNNCHEQQAH